VVLDVLPHKFMCDFRFLPRRRW